MTEEEGVKRAPPRGKAKGGTRFPRFPLKDALAWSRKLVSKTHTGPQPQDVVFSGVVGSRGPRGEIKVSALRQFGLLEGTPAGYAATALAREIAVLGDEPSPALYARAALTGGVFAELYNTFQGDTVSRNQLRGRASDLKVHPDELDNCVDGYLSAMQLAGMVIQVGDGFRHQARELQANPEQKDAVEEREEVLDEEPVDANIDEEGTSVTRPPRAVFNVNITLDSTLDTEKLERQLSVLRKYGAV